MKFKGYVYKFKINSSHNVLINDKRSSTHIHTFVISIFAKIINDDFIIYDEVESIVEKFLQIYDGKELNKVKPFNKIEPTLENIGDFLFDKLRKILNENYIELVKLEINETPTRVYVVNYSEAEGGITKGYKNTISKLVINSVMESSAANIMRNFEAFEDEEEEIRPEEHAKELLKPKKNRTAIKTAVALAFLIIAAIILVIYLKNLKGYPWGIDTYGHIFKADLLYKNMKQGNFYPLFTGLWYNGIQPFRYWAPLSYYILALLQFCAGGNSINAYMLFIGFIFLTGAFGWLLWGIKENRIFISIVFGVLWFFLPENIRLFFFEGNIPRVLITAIIPYLFYFLWQFVEKGKKSSIVPVTISMMLITLSHLMVAAMTGITSFIFMLIYSVTFKKFLRPFQAIASMLLSFAICGVWLYPALHGGLVSMDSGATSEVMQSLSTPFTISLNPFVRLSSIGNNGFFYYGLSIVLISAFGIIVSNKRSMSGFITVIIVFLGTTTAFIPVLVKLPLNQLLWMMRFTPIAYGIFILSLFNWKNCKKVFMFIFIIMLALDSSLSFNFWLYPSEKNVKVESLLKSAKNITRQRIALLDSSMFGSYPSFYISSEGKETAYSYGWAWQGAATASNIVLLNTALENGYYNYMFDRSLEMGCDTVVIRKASLKRGKTSFDEINSAAGLSNYRLYKETEEGYVYHRKTPASFGIVSDYSSLCIGRSAVELQLQYPSFKAGKSLNIEDYSIDELKKYKTIYLSDFKYNDRAKAEAMISKLSGLGVNVVIDMNKIPSDDITKRMVFMGVSAQPIAFESKMPDLFFKEQKYAGGKFDYKYKEWHTVYLQNLSKVTGISWINNKKFAFMGQGQGENKNVTFVGFNLMFHAMEDDDKNSINIMNEVMKTNEEVLPKRSIEAVDIKYGKNSIVINSPRNNLNTTLAFLDSYKSSSRIYEDENLLKVNRGSSYIKIGYPYLTGGIFLTILGLIGFLGLLKFIYRGEEIENEKNS